MRRVPYCCLAALLASGASRSAAQITLQSGQSWPASGSQMLVQEGAQVIDANGKNAVVLAGNLTNVTITPVTIANALRAVETKDDYATINGLRVTGLTAVEVQRVCIRLRGTVTNVLIDNVRCTMRDTPQVSPNMPEGIHLEAGNGVTIQNSSFDGFQMTMDRSQYWNGDGIATEREATNVRIINVSADDNTDSGFDLKSSNTWLDRVSAENNARNFRFWGPISIGTITVGDTVKRGGTSTTADIWIKGSADMPIIEIDRLVVRMVRPDAIIRVEDGPVDLRIGACDIQAPAGSRFIVSESSATRKRLGPGCPAS